MNKILIVAKREIAAVVRKKSFWLSTLALPAFIVIVGLISGFASDQAEQKFQNVEFIGQQEILIYDETGLVSTDLPENFKLIDDEENGINQVKEGTAFALFSYDTNLISDSSNKIRIYRQFDTVLTENNLDTTAISLIESSVYNNLTSEEQILLSGTLGTEITSFDNGEIKELDLAQFVAPGIVFVFYFIAVMFGNTFLLSSISEEKESRMIEIILTTVNSKQLLFGKILGVVGIIVTQIIFLLVFTLGAIQVLNVELPFALADIFSNFGVLIASIVFGILGFFIIAFIMIGAGAAMPTLKEAQSFSSVFILLSVFPLYFIPLILADPNGIVAQVLSYLPITSPIVLIGRNAIDPLPFGEVALGIVALVVQVLLFGYLAFLLFKHGSLKYNNRIDFLKIFGR